MERIMVKPLRHFSFFPLPGALSLLIVLAVTFVLASCSSLQTTLMPARTGIVQQVTDQGGGVSPIATPSPPKGLIVTSIEPVKSGPWLDVHWSPDGTKALVAKEPVAEHFLSYNEGYDANSKPFTSGQVTSVNALWLVDLKTGAEDLLLERFGSAAWSPSSNQVAVIAPTAADGTAGVLFILDLASGKQTELGPVDFLGSEYSVQWLHTGQVLAVHDGEMLAFDPTQQQAPQLIAMRLIRIGQDEAAQSGDPSTAELPLSFRLTTDAKRLAYLTSNREPRAAGRNLWLTSVEPDAAPVFVTNQSDGGYMEWSPDNQWLVFSTFHDLKDSGIDERLPDVRQLWVIDANGEQAHRLTQMNGYREPVSPVWSPDGALVAFGEFGTVVDPQLPALRAMSAHTGAEVPITWEAPPLIMGTPFIIWWAPSGDKWLVTYNGGPRELDHNPILQTPWLHLAKTEN